jgi:hypothetical protein
MKIHSVLHGCDEPIKANLESYWSKKLPRLEKLLVPYRPDLQDIRLTVHRHEQNHQRVWYEGRAVIHLPTGTLAAEIAMLQDRPESQVKADIQAARKTLKERLVAGGQAGEAGQAAVSAPTKGD